MFVKSTLYRSCMHLEASEYQNKDDYRTMNRSTVPVVRSEVTDALTDTRYGEISKWPTQQLS